MKDIITMNSASLFKQVQVARHANANGEQISMHHAFRTIGFTKVTLFTVFLLPFITDLILWWQIDNIIALWHGIFAFWSQMIGFSGEVENMPSNLLFATADLPIPAFDSVIPTTREVYINGLVAIALFAISFFLPEKMKPISYLFRTYFVIHLSAVLYFLISPDYFPYLLSDTVIGGLGLGIYILFLIPPLLGMIYYIFDFGLARKIMLTVLMLGYFILFIPMQYLLHALILHHLSLIFMPLLYLMFGLLMDVLVCVALYSYGMTWKKNNSIKPRT